MNTIDIVIPCFNGSGTIGDCLGGIAVQCLPGDWRKSVTVVDDASADGRAPRDVESEGSEIRLLRNPENMGRAATCNRGVGAGSGTIVVVLDCDCVFKNPQVLQRYIELIGEGTDAVFANVVSSRDDFGGRYTNDLADSRMKAAQKGRYLAMTSAGLAIRRNVFEALGGFSEDYRHYGFEDRDFIAMLMRRGCTLAVDERCLVEHLDAPDPLLSGPKLSESARYSAPVFYRRFPEAYRQTAYGRIDPRTNRLVPAFVAPVAGWFAAPVASLTAAAIRSERIPYLLKKLGMKATSLLSYLSGCRDSGR